MAKNYSSVEYLLNLPNKELGHIGSGISLEDKKIAEKNFSEVTNFQHAEDLNKIIDVVPDKPEIPQFLKDMGVSTVSNTAFPDHKPIPDNEPISTTQEEIHLQLQKQLAENKNPTEGKSWLARLMWKNHQKSTLKKEAA